MVQYGYAGSPEQCRCYCKIRYAKEIRVVLGIQKGAAFKGCSFLWNDRSFFAVSATLCQRIDLYFRVFCPQRLKSDEDVVFEEVACQIGLCVFGAVKAVEYLHIFIADEQVFRQSAFDGGSGKAGDNRYIPLRRQDDWLHRFSW